MLGRRVFTWCRRLGGSGQYIAAIARAAFTSLCGAALRRAPFVNSWYGLSCGTGGAQYARCTCSQLPHFSTSSLPTSRPFQKTKANFPSKAPTPRLCEIYIHHNEPPCPFQPQASILQPRASPSCPQSPSIHGLRTTDVTQPSQASAQDWTGDPLVLELCCAMAWTIPYPRGLG